MTTAAEPSAPAELAELQSFLGEVFRRPTAVAQDESLSRRAALYVAGNDRLSPAEQVDIYRRQFWMRHDDCLREDFPALCVLLGEEAWDALVEAYLAAFPPRSPSLRDLGLDVPTFLDSWDGLPRARARACKDAARYEVAFVETFDGRDPPPLDPARIAALTPDQWERATFVLSPLVARLRLGFAVHQLRASLRDAKEVDVERWLQSAERDVHVALFRKELVVHYEELSADAFAMLDALARGRTLLSACAAIAEGKSDEDAQALAGSLGEWFRRWASWGFIAEVVVP